MKELTLNIVKTDPAFQTAKYTPAAVSPTLKLGNCTTFCMCAWHWCWDAPKSYQIMKGRKAGGFPNAKDWYKDYLFEKGSAPKVAAIAVWDGSPANGNCGHVAFVKSFEGNKITVYQSNYPVAGYNYPYFEEKTFTVSVGKVTSGTGAKFLGFCYHPYYKEEVKTVEPKFVKGKNYITQYNCVVRTGAGVNFRRKTKAELTPNAQIYATNTGCIRKGTTVTCLETAKDNKGNIWMRIPSGWIPAYYEKDICVK